MTIRAVLYSLTETEIETEIYVISLSETEMETEMFCKTEMKYKRKSESIKRNSNWNEIDFTTKMITQNRFQKSGISLLPFGYFVTTDNIRLWH